MSDYSPNPEKPILSFKADECVEFEAVLEPVPGQPGLPPPRRPNEPILTVQVDLCFELDDLTTAAPPTS
jgi:hypothetical protein